MVRELLLTFLIITRILVSGSRGWMEHTHAHTLICGSGGIGNDTIHLQPISNSAVGNEIGW